MRRFTGHYPTSITIVGHAFKSKRFKEIHREALRWPIDKFNYVGVDLKTYPSGVEEDEGEIEKMYEGERKVLMAFSEDRYGCHGDLKDKRVNRNPYRRYHPYLSSNPELRGQSEYLSSPKGVLDWDLHVFFLIRSF